jgi:nucleoside-diphosphate-sugar epimerase
MQIVDVRDLARWLVHCAAKRVHGTYDAVGPPSTLGRLLEVAAELGGRGTPLPADTGWLVAQGVQEWMGDESLPLWLADRAEWGLGARLGKAVHAAGLTHRPLRECLADTLAWEADQQHPHGAGLTDERERELIAAREASGSSQ